MVERLDVEHVTLSQARRLIETLAADQSILLLSPPGVGKSETVEAAAAAAGLDCRSLLGTQIAPEDVSGVPRIVGERSVFCPPRVLLPESNEPFCLFLDELPAASPDIQKAFYSLLLERRIGEFPLPARTWVVAAGNRVEDRALVRTMSSALVNRVLLLHVRVDVKEWLAWARRNRVRPEILSFITFMPESLSRPVPVEPLPFSTPRSWTMLSQALDQVEAAGLADASTFRALAFGRLSPEDAALFSAVVTSRIGDLRPAADYVREPDLVPDETTAAWLVVNTVRHAVASHSLEATPEDVNRFLTALPKELAFAILVDQFELWGGLGADEALVGLAREVTGLS